MNKNRTVSYGYQIINGEITEKKDEADIVRWIFNRYEKGASYKKIADILTAKEVFYLENKNTWNKNNIKRILENRKYSGREDTTALITEENFDAVQNIIAGKIKDYTGRSEEIKALDKLIYCKRCGCRLKRNKKYERVWWKCADDDCTKLSLNDEELAELVKNAINEIMKHPENIKAEITEEIETIEIRRNISLFQRELEKEEFDEKYAKELIIKAALLKYERCDDKSNEKMSDKIRKLFKNTEKIEYIKSEFVNTFAEKIYIDENLKVTIRLKNGQSVEY